MDAAALAAGKQIGILTTDQVKAEAVNFFNANVGGKVTRSPTAGDRRSPARPST